MKKLNKKGFTIVELVIVIAVIAILAGVLIPTFAGVITKAEESNALQEAKNTYTEDLIALDGQISNYDKLDYAFKYVKTEDTEKVDGKDYYVKNDNGKYAAAGEDAALDVCFEKVNAPVFKGTITYANEKYTYSIEVGEYTATYADDEWNVKKTNS